MAFEPTPLLGVYANKFAPPSAMLAAQQPAPFYVIVERDEDDYYVGEVPQLSGCYAKGKTIDELMENMREVIQLALEDDSEVFEPIPEFIGVQKVVLPAYEYPGSIRDLKVDINRDKLFESNQIKGGFCHVHIHIVPCFWAQGYSV